MLTYTEAKLIYRHLTEDNLGNPIEVLTEKKVKARIDSTFSDYYYNERGRSQQMSMNLVVNAYLTKPLMIDGKQARIVQAEVDSTLYNVRAVLNDKTSRLRKILDCEQVLQ